MDDILVVYKKSSYQRFRDSDDDELRDFLKVDSPQLREMIKSHDSQVKCLDDVINHLDVEGLPYESIYRADLSKIHDKGLVISVGGDGTFLETSHYVEGIPILGVNSDPGPGGSVGFYCCCTGDGFGNIIDNLDKQSMTSVYRVKMALDGKVLPEAALNDILICHKNPAATTQLIIKDDDREYESGKGSGMLVSNAIGSSAFIYEEGGFVLDIESDEMEYTLRSKRDAPFLTSKKLELIPKSMNTWIYIDGPHVRYEVPMTKNLSLEAGMKLDIYGDLKTKRDDYLKKKGKI